MLVFNRRAYPTAHADATANCFQESFLRHGLTPKQCESEILAHLVAGSDTTANYIRVALVLVASTPHVYRRLQQEIDEGILSGRISKPVTFAEARRLSYLQAFIWEVMRFHPPVFMLFSKVVTPQGDTLAGQFVPGGTKIGFDSWSFGRREDIYGADAAVFRPERFIEADPETRLEMERNTELIFGAGCYTCAGKNVAVLELWKNFRRG